MTVTVLKLSDADTYLKNISIKNIKDVRALDVDLMLVLRNGDSIIISNGAVSAMSAPESSLQFADGKLPLASVFQQIEKIDVSPEANLTVSSKEITRYNQNNARNKKARKDDEEAGIALPRLTDSDYWNSALLLPPDWINPSSLPKASSPPRHT
jgi:glutamate 5-kinase